MPQASFFLIRQKGFGENDFLQSATVGLDKTSIIRFLMTQPLLKSGQVFAHTHSLTFLRVSVEEIPDSE